jgi:hypothetical protein
MDATAIGEFVSTVGAFSGGATVAAWLGVATFATKYSLDLLRSSVVQSWLPPPLRWANWTPQTRQIVGLAQGFLIAFIPGIGPLGWLQAALSAIGVAFAGKGLHDTGVLPGRKPTVYEPDVSRPLSIRTDTPDAVRDRHGL